jgi:hypothetical protein
MQSVRFHKKIYGLFVIIPGAFVIFGQKPDFGFIIG